MRTTFALPIGVALAMRHSQSAWRNATRELSTVDGSSSSRRVMHTAMAYGEERAIGVNYA
jgi:hypothetical protein